MVSMAEAIITLYPAARPLADFRVDVGLDGTETLSLWADAIGPQPTAEQLAAVTDAQVQAARDARTPEKTGLRKQVAAAINALAAYKALSAPTAAQRKAFEDRVCDALTAVIRRLHQLSEGA